MASKRNAQEYPIQVLREKLRQRSNKQAVAAEYAVIDRLLYAQQCRSSLERCIGSGSALLRYRWRDGRTTETRFRRTAPGKIKVSGLLAETA